VADLVLLEDSFAALPPAFGEGQRILGGMRDVVGLFLARSVAVTSVILGATLAEAPFPLTPKHNSLLAFFALGVPTLALAAWAKPARAGERLLKAIAPIVLAAMLTIPPVALIVYLSWWRVTDDIESSRTALTATLIGCGLLLVLFIRPPAAFWVTGEAPAGDRRPALVAGLMAIGFLATLQVGAMRRSFEVSELTPNNFATIALVLIGWTLIVRAELRGEWHQRLFGLTGEAAGRSTDNGRRDSRESS
jgi:cation-transporting ATPase E